jgi:hypothetical protein
MFGIDNMWSDYYECVDHVNVCDYLECVDHVNMILYVTMLYKNCI